MGWFDTPKSPPPREAKYTIEKVEALLSQFGPLRLRIANPGVKVLISQITWGVLPYIRAQGDPPSGNVIADAMTTLEMLIQTLDGYIKIQSNPDAYRKEGGAEALMQQGQQALAAYWQKISSGRTAAVQDLTAYQAVTAYLSGTSASQLVQP